MSKQLEADYIYDDISGEFISKNKLLEVYHSRSIGVKSDLNKVEQKLSELESVLASIMPFVITDVQIGNVYYDSTIETDYGKTIYHYNTMYLEPKIYYRGFCEGNYNLRIKWFKPDGSLSTGDSSPYDCSQADSYYFSKDWGNLLLSGWGNKSKGYWENGDYRLEIWYDNRCAFVKNFKIY